MVGSLVFWVVLLSEFCVLQWLCLGFGGFGLDGGFGGFGLGLGGCLVLIV